MSKMQKQRKENVYTVEQDGKPVAQAMAISQAEAVRLYVESVQQPTMTARLSSPLEARTLAGLPLLQREPAAVDTRTVDLFEATPAVCQRVMQNGQACGLPPGCPDCGSSLVDYPEPVALEVAAAPQGDLVPSALSTAALTVSLAHVADELLQADLLSTGAATPASPAPGQPTAAAGVATDVHEKTAGESSPTAASAEVEPHRSTAADDEPRHQAAAAAVRAGGNVVAKYRNPADGHTWTGRGLKPKWLVEAIEAGKTLDEFLIDPA